MHANQSGCTANKFMCCQISFPYRDLVCMHDPNVKEADILIGGICRWARRTILMASSFSTAGIFGPWQQMVWYCLLDVASAHFWHDTRHSPIPCCRSLGRHVLFVSESDQGCPGVLWLPKFRVHVGKISRWSWSPWRHASIRLCIFCAQTIWGMRSSCLLRMIWL